MEKAHDPKPIGLYVHLGREVAYTDLWLEVPNWQEESTTKNIQHIAVVYRDDDDNLKIKRRQLNPETIGTELDRFLEDTWQTIEEALQEFIGECPKDTSWKHISKDMINRKMTLVYRNGAEERMMRAIVPSFLYESYVFPGGG